MNDLSCVTLKGVDLNTGLPVPYIPLKTQWEFHNSAAKYRAFVAGLGCGKTQAAVIETICASLIYPHSFNAIVRWDQNSLKDTTWRTLNQIIQVSGLDPLITKQTNNNLESVIEWTNGSMIRGLHAKNWMKYGGLPLSSVFMDECHECPDSEAWDQLCARIDRSPVGPHRAWMAGLPNGHNWVWRKFYQEKLPGHQLFRGATYDNPFLLSTYAADMKAIYGEKALVMLLGSFETIEGRLLDNFGPIHILPSSRPVSAAWPRYAAVDPGFRPDPAAMLRIAVDPHGNIIVDGEYERCERSTEEWSNDIVALNAPHTPMWYVMDKSAFADDHRTPVSVAETARKCGINARKATHNIDQSVIRLRDLLTPRPDTTHPFTGEKGTFPRLYVMETCQRTIWEMTNFRMKKCGAGSMISGIKLPDHDHDLVDCLMYLALEHLTPASASAKPPMSAFWQEILNPPMEERPYMEQISRVRIDPGFRRLL